MLNMPGLTIFSSNTVTMEGCMWTAQGGLRCRRHEAFQQQLQDTDDPRREARIQAVMASIQAACARPEAHVHVAALDHALAQLADQPVAPGGWSAEFGVFSGRTLQRGHGGGRAPTACPNTFRRGLAWSRGFSRKRCRR